MRLTLCAFVTFQENITYLLTAIRASFGKIEGTRTQILATRCLSWAPNMPKLLLRPGLRPGPSWGSLQCSPKSPSWIKGPISKGSGKGRGGKGEGGEGDGREEEGGGEEGEGNGKVAPPILKFMDPPLIHSFIHSFNPLMGTGN